MSYTFEKPVVYIITQGDAEASNFTQKKKEILQLIRVASEAKISLMQIREKRLTARLLFELASEAVEITKTRSTKLLINGRADIAVAANADGVHLPSDSLPTRVVRNRFSNNFIIGVSTHLLEEAQAARAEGADFVTFGPVFDTPDKGEPHGLQEMNRVCALLKPFPVIALGGINGENCETVVQNGASGFASIRFLNDEDNLQRFLH